MIGEEEGNEIFSWATEGKGVKSWEMAVKRYIKSTILQVSNNSHFKSSVEYQREVRYSLASLRQKK
jgi:hypothetical protein